VTIFKSAIEPDSTAYFSRDFKMASSKNLKYF